ncbi:S-layer homology domain-containing protein [Lysinibacillus endophyticus]|uniref:S-layer homology domain-containing protein n=1 Tax=Ureibacillus endophyticus TaxID=1978490 RepID=UPI0020A0B259|nr:S-layer homology domain-containing protein [Lysinibacillus endophyticus]MCP1143678.1 S-layer homology domain-containing protein [Lysinibacillus endophyticus]
MKNRNKWFASVAATTIVASAVVPAASAASFVDIEGNSHKEAILALAEAKIVSGYPGGLFKPNAVVTRGNVTKFLGKWLIAEGFAIPADYTSKARFADLPTSAKDQELLQFAALVKDAEVFKGSNNQLQYNNNISREQMAVVLVRAIKQVYGIDLISLYKEVNFKTSVTDISNLPTEKREAIIALDFAKITTVTTFNPKNSLTRGQFASFLNRTIVNITGQPKPEPGKELAIKKVIVTDNTTLKVTLSDNTTHTVILSDPLEKNIETKVDFTINEKHFSTTVTYVKTESDAAVSVKELITDGVVSLKSNPVTKQLSIIIESSKLTGDLAGKEATDLVLVVDNQNFAFTVNLFNTSYYEVLNTNFTESQLTNSVIRIK